MAHLQSAFCRCLRGATAVISAAHETAWRLSRAHGRPLWLLSIIHCLSSFADLDPRRERGRGGRGRPAHACPARARRVDSLRLFHHLLHRLEAGAEGTGRGRCAHLQPAGLRRLCAAGAGSRVSARHCPCGDRAVAHLHPRGPSARRTALSRQRPRVRPQRAALSPRTLVVRRGAARVHDHLRAV